MKKLITFLLAVALTSMVSANNITVTNILLTGQNTTSDYTMVQFDLSWENSWRTSSAPNNWDAAWVFVKYRVTDENGGDGLWHHASLNNVGHTAPSGSTIDIGLLTPATDFNATTNPCLGTFIYRSANGTGTNAFTGAQLRWNYGVNYSTAGSTLIGDDDIIDIQVFAIEMVYVPQGTFALGSGGSESDHFFKYPTSTNPYSVSTEAAISVGNTADNLYYSTYLGYVPIPLAFPKGYAAFYCMKYEISQQGYVDFLNTLSYTQQATRTEVSNPPNSVAGSWAFNGGNAFRNGIAIQTPGVSSATPAVYACNLVADGNYSQSDDGQWIACGGLYWIDVAAYLDWSGLRPMTELEFEKSCRGTESAVANEYAWGTTGIASSFYEVINSGATDEVITTNYSTTLGNAQYSFTNPFHPSAVPARVGIFADNSNNTGRVTAGATYYGIMEMSGNLVELCVTVSNAAGRSFTGNHGNGLLDATGNPDPTMWPGTCGGRGGNTLDMSNSIRVSDRAFAAASYSTNRSSNVGGRGVRTAPSLFIGQSYGGGIIFYIDGTGQHGLIAAASDQTGDWGCYGTTITGADGSAIGTGSQNTIDILAECSEAGIAAKLCDDLDEGGYQDWYLPSYSELNELYINRASVGSFAVGYYWCSTEYTLWYAWTQAFWGSGTFRFDDKIHDYNYVRAIRSF